VDIIFGFDEAKYLLNAHLLNHLSIKQGWSLLSYGGASVIS